MTVMPLGRDQDCSLKNREPDVPAPWFLDPGGWSKTAAVSLYFIFPGICTLSLLDTGIKTDLWNNGIEDLDINPHRTWKQPRCLSSEEWIRKMWYIYTMEYYATEKNNDIMKFAGKRMELENVILSEVDKTYKLIVTYACHLYSFDSCILRLTETYAGEQSVSLVTGLLEAEMLMPIAMVSLHIYLHEDSWNLKIRDKYL
ncbi:hypothetical protein STEG23_019944, partial [Scotinomys teguina]